MTSRQIALIRASWQQSSVHADTIGKLFYYRLFEIAPDLRIMFSHAPIDVQSKKLIHLLSYILSNLENERPLVTEVTLFAQGNVQHQLMENYYRQIGAALLWTLEKGTGDGWNEETFRAWEDCYQLFSTAVIGVGEGSRKHTA